ncbi:hypothetical protein ASG56_04065 [Rhodococcus sp. Leaf7]|uniref:hypothetical protein n=1 Tax=unclassified Rhodococcus (in: high G+C Gram-positive bacteria) TaxID=192944 RepID=UPI0005ABCDDD|nr:MULTISPECIES: hypothetical protein [unclassified Rhodococcus (in: high G+C Gram-positive bacteria)]KIQ15977.1 membrane protein [Rhodococcus sp. MEB064]KQU06795.1 hypothetical protein ASG56_04065 [Rhodococcus sp. Leaf7]KQU42314.1 hypothetical protein ASG64_04065 [Rhodococcus sp. Leaf247]
MAGREKVVLAQRRGARIVRTRVEVQEQTEVGEAMINGLVRTQLALALRTAAVVVLLLGIVPVVWVLAPAAGAVQVLGIGLPWWLLAVGSYPLLLVAGYRFVRSAERNEQEFTELVED